MNGNPRVIVSNPLVNIFTMQVCAVGDATDEEILAVCNRDNPAGTEHGWTTVLRADKCDDSRLGRENNKVPVQCQEYGDRRHFLVLC